MILSFTQQINGQPNYFIEKIWEGILDRPHKRGADYEDYLLAYIAKFGKNWDGVNIETLTHDPVDAKLHTIRTPRRTKAGDIADKQWRAGNLIHPAINNRSPDYFQFAPVIKCVSVQPIQIIVGDKGSFVKVEDEYGKMKYLGWQTVETLAVNDGFANADSFFQYFKDGLLGSIIHWTDLRY